MKIYCDGGCRGNGKPNPIGAAAIIFKKEKKTWRGAHAVALPSRPRPTNQRAELLAITIALEKALQKYNSLKRSPLLELTIRTDSDYSVRCMNEWIPKWRANGWKNSRGREVANRDLIEKADAYHDRLSVEGDVTFEWVSRDSNRKADELVNNALDMIEDGI